MEKQVTLLVDSSEIDIAIQKLGQLKSMIAEIKEITALMKVEVKVVSGMSTNAKRALFDLSPLDDIAANKPLVQND